MDLATGAMGSLLPKLVQLLNDEYKLQKGVRKDIESLSQEMKSMQAALRKVGGVPRDQLDEQVRVWAGDVRELSYDMEDVVDSFLVNVDGSEPAANSDGFRGLMKKMGNLFKKGKTRHQIANAIEDIKNQVQEVAARRDRYRVDDAIANQTAASTVDPRMFALYKDKQELVGTEEARDEVIKRLACGDDDSFQKKLKILSIFGFGGLGKTTLAKEVYDKVQAEFDSRAFVSVGRTPDVKVVLKDILLEFDKQKYMSFNTTTLSEKHLIDELRGFLRSKRYFIVIDDIWNTAEWNIIRCALMDNNQGSRVITTTRIFEVAAETNDVYKLEPLSRDHSEELFYKRIFGEKNGSCHDQQADLSKNFIRKCEGVPLAIITIASLLVGKPRDDWEDVYSSIGFGHGADNEDVDNTRKILLFSYYDLPSYLRSCLLHLSTFPEDHLILKDTLIWKWAAEGFIHEESAIGTYELGERYFSQLINRCMIQPIELSHSGIIIGCHVHDMVLDMIRSLSDEENFVTILDSDKQWQTSQKRSRRLAVQGRTIDQDNLANMGTPHVRSFNATGCHLRRLPSLWSFQALRVLSIEDCDFEEDHPYQLEDLGRLLHLRYLGLRKMPIVELPKEIGKLGFLQTLDLWESKIEELPKSVVLLRQLKCLRVGNSSDILLSVPDGMDNLTSLEELMLGQITESPSFVKELGLLTDLRKLIIEFSYEFDESRSRTLLESLGNLQKIKFLTVAASSANLEGYVPPRGLNNLSLWIGPNRLQTWMNSLLLPNLAHLQAETGTEGSQDMEILGRFPELVTLVILGFDDAIIDVVGGGSFPKLRECFMPAIPRFHHGAMPCLERLDLDVEVRDLKDAIGEFDFSSLGNLSCLREVVVDIKCLDASAEEVEEAETAVRQAVDSHPNRPNLELTRDGNECYDESEEDEESNEDEEAEGSHSEQTDEECSDASNEDEEGNEDEEAGGSDSEQTDDECSESNKEDEEGNEDEEAGGSDSEQMDEKVDIVEEFYNLLTK